MIDLMGTGKIPKDRLKEIINEVFDLRPAAIIQYLDLLRPIYKQTAAYGHFGRNEPGFSCKPSGRAPASPAAAPTGGGRTGRLEERT